MRPQSSPLEAWNPAVAVLACWLVAPYALRAEPPRPAATSLRLEGDWAFSIHGRGRKTIRVPSTYLPVGGATLERTFQPPPLKPGQRLLMRFDGIVMTGELFLNDKRLGRYGPYTPFTLDITDRAKRGENFLRAELTDLDGFKPWDRAWVTAFPRLGGIIRPVVLDVKESTYIKNIRLNFQLSKDYAHADCDIHVWLVNTEMQPRRVDLAGSVKNRHGAKEFGATVQARPGTSHHTLKFAMDRVALWSPESPECYDLSVSVMGSDGATDTFQTLTGFKEFVTRGRDFYLNGQKYFLKGLFRHDLYGDQGHTLTREQMEAEIADIKSLGCNYLRLGHYPQHALITELAARHGLLTSGEPPIFGQDLKSPEVLAGAKFCLGGLIERDWNSPAAAFWVIANESGTRPLYLKEMAAFVRGLDPQRLVTIVDNTKLNRDNVPWAAFREAGLDFICQNAYGAASNGYYTRLEELLPDDMPFVISEWGGPSHSYAGVLGEGRYYLDHSTAARATGPRIAGISFWEYQDIPLRCWTEEGLLHWSLVDVNRQPYEAYYALKSLYTGRVVLPPRGRLLVPNFAEQLPRPMAPPAIEPLQGYELVDLSRIVNSDRVLAELKAVSPLAYPEGLPLGTVAVAGLPFSINRQLVALSKTNPMVRVSIDRAASEVLFQGHVCFNSLNRQTTTNHPPLPYLVDGFPLAQAPSPFKAYPHAGAFGEVAAAYVLVYEDGQREEVPLQNGIHLADYRTFLGFSPIDAVATDTERVVHYKGDYGAKTYQMRLFAYRPRQPAKKIREIIFHLKDIGYVPLLAGVTVRLN